MSAVRAIALPGAPADLLGFDPSAERAAFLDQRMRARLSDSLNHILERGGGALEVSMERLEQFLVELGEGPISPLAFSYYSDVVLAIEEDDIEGASRLLTEMTALPICSGTLSISDLGDSASDPIAERYARFINTDESFKFEIFPPAAEAAANCRSLIAQAFALMDAGDPELGAEIRGLVREIVVAAGSLDTRTMTFDGASAFMLWGAIIINANQRSSELAMVQMLAHESAHNLLFGLSADEPLVENLPDELFPSPLRQDPRPMDGIYHATFVTARMHRAVNWLLKSRILSAGQTQVAEKELAADARLFRDGIQTVERFGKLTSLGEAVMAGAKEYMRREG